MIFTDNDCGWLIGRNLSQTGYTYHICRTSNGGIVSVENNNFIQATDAFRLKQNYPNPFNPITKIKFEIPSQAQNENLLVTLKVYDVLGNEIATLVNEEKPSGTYEVDFDGSKLPSGIYFYRLKAGLSAETKKMILLK